MKYIIVNNAWDYLELKATGFILAFCGNGKYYFLDKGEKAQ